MSRTDIDQALQLFAVSLVEHCGGVVDWPPEAPAGQVLLPAEAARWFGQEEAFPISSAAGSGGLHVGLAGDFIDLAGHILAAHLPQLGDFSLGNLYLKKGDLERAVEKAFYWPNARVRYQGSQAATGNFHTWWFHVELRSEDTWEWRPRVSLHVESGAPVALPDPLELVDLTPSAPVGAPTTDTFPLARRGVERQLAAAAATFLDRLDTRRQRDQKRLRDYYQALLRDTGATSRRSKVELTPQQIEDRSKAVKLELQRKLGELDERYAVEGRLRGLILVRWQIPVLQIDLEVKRKQALRTLPIYWNALLKEFEPVACSACGEGIFTVHFTNDSAAPCCHDCFERQHAAG